MPEFLAFIIVLGALVLFMAAVYFRSGRREAEEEMKAILQRRNPVTPPFGLGNYVSGLRALKGRRTMESRKTVCVVTESSYVIVGFPEDSWEEVGEIPRDAVNGMSIEREAPALHGRGQESREEGWLLYIDWNDEMGTQRVTAFEFRGPSAYRAAGDSLGKLRQYLRRNPYRRKRAAP